MRALLRAALICLWAQCIHGFFFSPGSYRDARQNYYEVLNNCEKEGGECLDVDFGTTDPPSPDPTPTPAPRPTTTRAPPPPAPVTPPLFWYPFWPFIPTAQAPVQTTRAPRPTTRAPRPITRAPRPTTRAPRPTTRAPAAVPPTPVKVPVKKARKVGRRRKGRRRQRNREVEREVRKRRQAFGPDPWDYLYNECTGGWEFDVGCGARGGNVCCYSSNSGNSYK